VTGLKSAFGSFKVKIMTGIRSKPKTGELIEVRSKKLPFFKVGKELKEEWTTNDNARPSSLRRFLASRKRF